METSLGRAMVVRVVMSATIDRSFAAFRLRATNENLVSLLDACRPRAVGFCFRILRNREDAEDAAQLVLLEIACHASDMLDAADFRSWFFRVCRSRSVDLQ